MSSEITRYRGDTVPDEFTVKTDKGFIVNITGAAFKLTVNSVQDPVGTGTQLFTITGVVAAPTTGVVSFPFTSVEADQAPGTYYYDVQMTDAGGKIQTLVKDTYTYVQDITKT